MKKQDIAFFKVHPGSQKQKKQKRNSVVCKGLSVENKYVCLS